jgi:hypothetical protein
VGPVAGVAIASAVLVFVIAYHFGWLPSNLLPPSGPPINLPIPQPPPLPPPAISCCTRVNYTDEVGPVTNGYFGMVDASRAIVTVPRQDPTCAAPYPNRYRSIGKNSAPTGPGADAVTNMNPPSDWPTEYPLVKLMMNANFFDANGSARDPYFARCTDVYGLAVGDQIVSSPPAADPKQSPFTTDTLIFFTPAAESAAGKSVTIEPAVSATDSRIQNAVSGYRLLAGGILSVQPPGLAPGNQLPRAAVGVKADGKTVVVVVVNNGSNTGGTTLTGLASFMKDLGVVDAINLDGSGSAQLFYGPTGTTTLPSDFVPCGGGKCSGGATFYRPVPMFLGFE